jgi:hypothetical protein
LRHSVVCTNKPNLLYIPTSLEGTKLPEGTSISVLVIFFLQRLSITIQKKEMQASSILSQTGTMGLAHGLSTLPLLNTPPISTVHLLQAIHSGARLPTITSLLMKYV